MFDIGVTLTFKFLKHLKLIFLKANEFDFIKNVFSVIFSIVITKTIISRRRKRLEQKEEAEKDLSNSGEMTINTKKRPKTQKNQKSKSSP